MVPRLAELSLQERESSQLPFDGDDLLGQQPLQRRLHPGTRPAVGEFKKLAEFWQLEPLGLRR